jgi:hypothetical protein
MSGPDVRYHTGDVNLYAAEASRVAIPRLRRPSFHMLVSMRSRRAQSGTR